MGPFPRNWVSCRNLLELRIGDNSLSGPIPPELGTLSILENLFLDDNGLTGAIPPELGGLSNLDRLFLSKNQLEGSIPPELGNLSTLVGLYLSQNQLTGSIPPEFIGLSNLFFLHLESNQLSGLIPPELGGLSNLTSLYLYSNQISGSIPAELGDLSNLRDLYLGDNRLSGSIPPELGNLTDLLKLRLESNQLSGLIPPELGGLSSLWRLYLYSNYLSGPIPSELGDLSELQELRLSSNQLVGEIPVTLIFLTNLGNSGNDLNFNGLYSEDPAVRAFLEQKFGPSWEITQTVAPGNIVATTITDHSVWLSWDPVTYTDPGGYEVFVSPTGTGLWTSAGWTKDKSVTEFPATGLTGGTSYDFGVASFTQPHAQNDNFILSSISVPIMATSANTGCSEPAILIDWGAEITLSVGGTYDNFLWSTGETSPTIVVAPTSPQWYWVVVTFAGPCEETAAVFIDPAIVFADGFQRGDTSAWSHVTP